MTRKPLRVGSYNVRKCVGLDRRRDPERILSVVAALGADVVALQEADRRLGDRPTTLDRDSIAEMTGMRAVDLGPDHVSLGWHGNAILVAPDIEVTGVRRLVLPGLEPRGAALVSARHHGLEVRIAAVHLGLTRHFRRLQLDRIARVLERGDSPAVIMGDFNEWRDGMGLEPLKDRFSVHAPGLTFHASRPVAALDRIAVSEGVELSDAGVLDTEVTRIASDHLPVWAALDLTVA